MRWLAIEFRFEEEDLFLLSACGDFLFLVILVTVFFFPGRFKITDYWTTKSKYVAFFVDNIHLWDSILQK